MPMMTARTLSVAIARDWRDVHAFAANPQTMPQWAAGLASGLTREGHLWRAGGPLGSATVSFAPDNDFGVIDHDVTLADGRAFHNPLRVMQNGDGALVSFTLFRQPDMTDGQFEADAAAVERDLASLKAIVEGGEHRTVDGEARIRLNYLEMTVTDIEASKHFYGTAFGWSFVDYGPDYCEFDDGRMKGGFTMQGTVRPGGPLVVLHADDLEDAERRVRAAGGTIVTPIFAFPGGRRFHFTDPDGQELAVWSP